MKKILFPTDFLDQAPEIFKYASELAYYLKASLVVMHVYNEPEIKMLTKKESEQMSNEAADELISFVEKNLSKYHQNLKIEYVTNSGFTSKAILDVASSENIELIVMGGSGKTDLVDKIFGSTTLDVLSKSDCPVLAIPSAAKFDGIDNIIYTTNFEFRDIGAISYLKKWSVAMDTPLHCLHIIEQGDREWNAIKNMSIMKKLYKGHKRMEFQIKIGKFYQELELYAKSKKVDIIAMTTHKKNFLARLIEQSAVKKVAFKTSIPLLLIKDDTYEIDSDSTEWINILNSIA